MNHINISQLDSNISKGLSYLIKELNTCQEANDGCDQCEKLKPCRDVYDSHCNRPIGIRKANEALTQILQLHLKIPHQKEAIN